MINMYIQLSSGLKKITNEITSEQVINALGYQPATKNDLNNIFSSESDEFYIVDASGNIIAKIDKEGLHTTEVEVGSGMKLKEHIQNALVHVTEEDKQRWNSTPELENIDDDESGEFNLVDANGNIILKVDADGLHSTQTHTQKLFLNGKELNFEEAGGNIIMDPLPETGEEDNGKVLQVVNGEWSKAELTHPQELPSVEESDNNKILKVVDGSWKAADLPNEKELPIVSETDNNKFLQVVDGAWAAAAMNVEEFTFVFEDGSEMTKYIPVFSQDPNQ